MCRSTGAKVEGSTKDFSSHGGGGDVDCALVCPICLVRGGFLVLIIQVYLGTVSPDRKLVRRFC